MDKETIMDLIYAGRDALVLFMFVAAVGVWLLPSAN